jgi:hypothetical protein
VRETRALSRDRPPSDRRRRFLLGLCVALVAALVAWWRFWPRRVLRRRTVIQPFHDPQQALVHIVTLVGPWPQRDRGIAEAVARKIVAASERPLLGVPAAAVLRIGNRFRDLGGAAQSLDLSSVSESDRRELLRITARVYAHPPVISWVRSTPMPGVCVGGDYHVHRPESDRARGDS